MPCAGASQWSICLVLADALANALVGVRAAALPDGRVVLTVLFGSRVLPIAMPLCDDVVLALAYALDLALVGVRADGSVNVTVALLDGGVALTVLFGSKVLTIARPWSHHVATDRQVRRGVAGGWSL